MIEHTAKLKTSPHDSNDGWCMSRGIDSQKVVHSVGVRAHVLLFFESIEEKLHAQRPGVPVNVLQDGRLQAGNSNFGDLVGLVDAVLIRVEEHVEGTLTFWLNRDSLQPHGS